jgi:hypothetical protein
MQPSTATATRGTVAVPVDYPFAALFLRLVFVVVRR